MALLLGAPLSAKLRFGDKNAAIKISSGGTLQVNGSIDVVGTVARQTGGSITGDGTLTFTDGVFNEEGTVVNISGIYDPSSNALQMTGNQRMIVDPGTVLASVAVSGADNVIKGQPTFSSPITLADSESELVLGIQTALNQNVELSGGMLSLSDDLVLADNEFIVGPGTLNTQTRKLHTGNADLTAATALTVADTTHIVLNAPLTLTNTWTCQGNVYINANGYPINLTDGTLAIAANATLTIVDAQIKGWATNSIALADTTSKLRLADVDAKLLSSVTYSVGTVEIFGNSAVTLKSSLWIFDGVSTLTVNGSVLTYDTVEYEFITLNAGHITSLNGGTLRNMNGSSSGPVVITESGTLTTKFALDPLNTMTFEPPAPDTLVVNYSGYDVTFSSTDTVQMELKAGSEAEMTNVVVRNFVPAAVAIAESASLTFGDNARVEMGGDHSTTFPLIFNGAASLDGGGYTLTVSKDNNIQVKNGATLTLKNMTIAGMSESALSGLASDSTIICENVTFLLSDTTTFSTGALLMSKSNSIIGGKRFIYTSPTPLTINAFGSLSIGADTTYAYDPSDGNTSGLLFADSTAQLILENSVFEVANTGAILKKGTIIVNDAATIESLATSLSGALVFGDGTDANNNVTIKIGARGSMIVNSGIVHLCDA